MLAKERIKSAIQLTAIGLTTQWMGKLYANSWMPRLTSPSWFNSPSPSNAPVPSVATIWEL